MRGQTTFSLLFGTDHVVVCPLFSLFPMMLLEISDVRGGYGGADILHGVTLEVGEREIVTIAGTNGAGKSTLAKAVIGLLPKVSGRIAFDGAPGTGE